MSPSLDRERGAWVIYCNLHVLELGGVPASADMREFAPELWEEQTRTPATYHVYNDAGLSPNDYVRELAPRGRTVRVNERLESPPVEPGATDEADEADGVWEATRRAELWNEATTKIAERGNEHERDRFDTSGFSCRGIVPRRPLEQW
tara:strand:+ start:47 stop:490 length:444 start_codon:yes stop_codon:yes gene_type:complete